MRIQSVLLPYWVQPLPESSKMLRNSMTFLQRRTRKPGKYGLVSHMLNKGNNVFTYLCHFIIISSMVRVCMCTFLFQYTSRQGDYELKVNLANWAMGMIFLMKCTGNSQHLYLRKKIRTKDHYQHFLGIFAQNIFYLLFCLSMNLLAECC